MGHPSSQSFRRYRWPFVGLDRLMSRQMGKPSFRKSIEVEERKLRAPQAVKWAGTLLRKSRCQQPLHVQRYLGAQ